MVRVVLIDAEHVDVCSATCGWDSAAGDDAASRYECSSCGNEQDESGPCESCGKFVARTDAKVCPDCGDDVRDGFVAEVNGERVALPEDTLELRLVAGIVCARCRGPVLATSDGDGTCLVGCPARS